MEGRRNGRTDGRTDGRMFLIGVEMNKAGIEIGSSVLLVKQMAAIMAAIAATVAVVAVIVNNQ